MNKKLYNQAKEFYEEVFYRIVYLRAENSVGFHNPTEAVRITGDVIAFASKFVPKDGKAEVTKVFQEVVRVRKQCPEAKEEPVEDDTSEDKYSKGFAPSSPRLQKGLLHVLNGLPSETSKK